jgi:hypothetical protein
MLLIKMHRQASVPIKVKGGDISPEMPNPTNIPGSKSADFVKLDLFRSVSAPLNIIVDVKSKSVIEDVTKQFSKDGDNWVSFATWLMEAI